MLFVLLPFIHYAQELEVVEEGEMDLIGVDDIKELDPKQKSGRPQGFHLIDTTLFLKAVYEFDQNLLPKFGHFYTTPNQKPTRILFNDSIIISDILGLIGDQFFVSARTQSTGNELWVYSLKNQQASLVKEMIPGSNGKHIQNVVVKDEKLYFMGTDEQHGKDLWVSNGTASGTHLIVDAFEDQDPFIKDLINFRDHLYYWGKAHLYRSNGEKGNGMEIKIHNDGDINYNAIVPLGESLLISVSTSDGGRLYTYEPSSNKVNLIKTSKNKASFANLYPTEAVKGYSYFTIRSDDPEVTGLWKTNGKSEGTIRIPMPDTSFTDLRMLYPIGDRIYFTAFADELGGAIWVLDCENDHIFRLVNTLNLPKTPYPHSYIGSPGRVYFQIGLTDKELWMTDGTEAGTKCIMRTSKSQDFTEYVLLGNNLIFNATILGTLERELFHHANGNEKPKLYFNF